MPEKILGMSRIIISNGRELLCQKKLGKNCLKNGDYLQYLLIKNGYVIIKRFVAEKAIRQVEEKRLISAKLTAPQCK
jgi:DNA-binding transcriptional regulator GbsR (MarR family)